MQPSDHIERPWLSGLCYAIFAIVAFAFIAMSHVFRLIHLENFLGERLVNPLTFVAAPVLLIALCFGYPFLGHRFGRHTARWVLAGTIAPFLIAFIVWMVYFHSG